MMISKQFIENIPPMSIHERKLLNILIEKQNIEAFIELSVHKNEYDEKYNTMEKSAKNLASKKITMTLDNEESDILLFEYIKCDEEKRKIYAKFNELIAIELNMTLKLIQSLHKKGMYIC